MSSSVLARRPLVMLGGLIAAATLGTTALAQKAPASAPDDPYAHLPKTIPIGAVVRDFRAYTDLNGHPDFENRNNGLHFGLVADTLDADGKPVMASPFGYRVLTQYKNAAGQNILPSLFDPARKDIAGSIIASDRQSIEDGASLAQWYRDIPCVNVSKGIELVLVRQPNSDRYVFDSDTDEPWKSIGGYFPIDQDLYGNYGDWPHNFHFTTEISSQFTFEKDKGHIFTFTGDDDVWVFIGGKLVLDVGGIHGVQVQTIELDRLAWLEDGKTYSFKIFHAERHTRESNFRMETTLQLKPIAPPQTTGLYD